METLRIIAAVLIGLGSGIVVSGAVFAFITIVGVVPRLAQKTRTKGFIKTYESAIVLGGLFGTVTGIVQIYLPIGSLGVAAIFLANGIFVGMLAMSLAEVLDVIPILTRRGRLQQGMFFFILAIAAGKMLGSILYFMVPGFYSTHGT